MSSPQTREQNTRARTKLGGHATRGNFRRVFVLSRFSLVEITDYSQCRSYPVDRDSSKPVLPPQFESSQFKCRLKKGVVTQELFRI